MSRFKLGQRVVAVRTNNANNIIKNSEYIVDGFGCCSTCGEPCIYLKGFDRIATLTHNGGHKEARTREKYLERNFAPLSNISDAVEYRLSVSIPELTEIKELQNQ